VKIEVGSGTISGSGDENSDRIRIHNTCCDLERLRLQPSKNYRYFEYGKKYTGILNLPLTVFFCFVITGSGFMALIMFTTLKG